MNLASKREKLTEIFFTKNMKTWLYIFLLVVLVAFRMAIAYSQRVFLLPEGSGIDDMLMIRAAQSITDGNWLGQYGAFTMAKNMGFAVWLAMLHTLHIPVLLGNTALWLLACGFSVFALKPLFRGNIGKLFVFALLAFQPFSYAFYTQRVYRDAVFPAFSLFFFAGIVGLCLRFFFGKAKGAVFVGIVCGLGLSGAWLSREDGSLLLIFAVAAAIVLLIYLSTHKPRVHMVKKLICLCLPFVILGAGIAGFSAVNYSQYGVFMVSDMTQGDFASAYGAMTAVSYGESGYKRFTPVSNDALEKMYAEVPLLAELRPELESGTVKSGFGSMNTDEFAGSFYFGLRYAADLGGHTPNAKAAQEYWQTLENQIEKAVEEGRLQSIRPVAGTVPKLDGSMVMPVIQASGEYFLALFTFSGDYGRENIRPEESIGPEEKVQAVSDYLYSPYQTGYVEGTEEPYYNVPQRICFMLCDIITWIYRILSWILFLIALVCLCKGFTKAIKGLKKGGKLGGQLAFSIITLGLLLSVLLRVGVCGYMEVAAFDIGVYLMYLSAAVPPFMLFLLASFGAQQVGKLQEELETDEA